MAIGDDPTLQLMGVVPATERALARAGLALPDLDWIEINEAFAAVVLAWARELEPESLEACLLEAGQRGRKFRRLSADDVRGLLGA